MSKLKLENEFIYLREISDADTDTDMIIRWRNSSHVKSNFIYRKDLTKEEHLQWLQNKVYTGKVKQFIIFEKKENLPIGCVYLRDIDYKNKKAEFGIYIGEKNKINKGYGTMAANIIVEYAFKQLKLNKVFLRVLKSNVRAIKSYEKVGFIQEGLFKQDELIDNQFYDIVFMAIISDR